MDTISPSLIGLPSLVHFHEDHEHENDHGHHADHGDSQLPIHRPFEAAVETLMRMFFPLNRSADLFECEPPPEFMNPLGCRNGHCPSCGPELQMPTLAHANFHKVLMGHTPSPQKHNEPDEEKGGSLNHMALSPHKVSGQR